MEFQNFLKIEMAMAVSLIFRNKFTELASFFCYIIVLFSESKCSIGRFGGLGQL